jgi:uncharacterized membrane protein
MERWFIVGSVIAIFLVLAVAGWHFQQTEAPAVALCGSADAQCDGRRL